jgi:hypothetical protein
VLPHRIRSVPRATNGASSAGVVRSEVRLYVQYIAIIRSGQVDAKTLTQLFAPWKMVKARQGQVRIFEHDVDKAKHKASTQ